MADCIFCKIAQHEIKADIVFEDDKIIAFRDIAPKAPSHIVIIPKIHIDSIGSLNGENADIVADIMIAAGKIAQDLGIDKSGFRVVSNTGPDASQAVPHLHFHLLGGGKLGDIC
ncbi:MAG: histidine triad nucleotide-binding protein [Patescibacteria group bacterium]